MDAKCPVCDGKKTINASSGLVQMCPSCEGSGKDQGVERFFSYIYQVVMTANQILLNQRIVINGDAPFRLKLITRKKTGDFRIRLFDSGGSYYSSSGTGGTNDRVRDDCICGDGSLPFVVFPHIEIPTGGSIGFDLEDVSAAGNTVHLAFHGAKVYPTPRD